MSSSCYSGAHEVGRAIAFRGLSLPADDRRHKPIACLTDAAFSIDNMSYACSKTASTAAVIERQRLSSPSNCFRPAAVMS
jgi:hypothetical protein